MSPGKAGTEVERMKPLLAEAVFSCERYVGVSDHGKRRDAPIPAVQRIPECDLTFDGDDG
ncbi:hypothetical protein GCM10009734_28590 [Nonomuraea bangladeshensis]